MKKIIFTALFLLAVLRLAGQSHGLTYQAVIIDDDGKEIPGIDINGNYMPNVSLNVRFTILDAGEQIDYQEEHATTTDSYGMINLTIGRGTMTAASPDVFKEIDWDGTPKYLRVEISLGESASDFSELSFQELLFVPYAYHRNITATGTLMVDGVTDLNNTLNVNNGSATFLSGELTVAAVSRLNGQVTINADVNGTDNLYESYPLRVEGSNQGIAIAIDGSRNSDNNFITFLDANGIQGRVEGQTSGDVASDPQYIFDNIIFGIQLGAQIANLATAAAATILDPGNLIIETLNMATLIAEMAAYETFAFDNLGVTYESGSGDYAEWLPRLNPDERIESGQIVGVYGGRITKKTDGAEQLMVVSRAPIVLGNMPPDSLGEKYCEKVGFMGQVPVWVIGKAKEGDYIIPYQSGSGFGKAITPEELTVEMMSSVVGRAWSNGDNNNINLVNTLIGVKSNEWIGFIKSNRDEIGTLKGEIKQLKAQIDRSNEILSQLLPEYKQALESDNNKPKNESLEMKDETSVHLTRPSGLIINRETILESFAKTEQLLIDQGYNIEDFQFYSKIKSNPEYREKVIAKILKIGFKSGAENKLEK